MLYSVLESDLKEIERKNLLRSLKTIEGPQNSRVKINSKEVLLFCSNNYLGLANHPRIIDAVIKATKKYGYGAVASRLVSGNMRIHEECEKRIAEFKKTEECLLFSTGYMANLGVISAICDSASDMVISDKLNHASIIDGVMLSKAKFAFYPHNDLNKLEYILKTKTARRKLVVVDGVFSMDGDIAPLKDISFLCKKYGAFLMVDDAHATGVIGKTGRGSCEYWEMWNEIDIQMGTLGKALGGFGAFVCGSEILKKYLINKVRPFIFTTALPPPVVAAAIEAINILDENPQLVEKLRNNVKLFVRLMKDKGFDIKNNNTAIVPIVLGSEEKTLLFSKRLLDEGIYVAAIRPPTVPRGTSRLRVTFMATHTEDDIKFAVDIFSKIKQELL